MFELFRFGNDAFVFMDAVVEWNFDRPFFDEVSDYHRFQTVFMRVMGW